MALPLGHQHWLHTEQLRNHWSLKFALAGATENELVRAGAEWGKCSYLAALKRQNVQFVWVWWCPSWVRIGVAFMELEWCFWLRWLEPFLSARNRIIVGNLSECGEKYSIDGPNLFQANPGEIPLNHRQVPDLTQILRFRGPHRWLHPRHGRLTGPYRQNVA